VNTTNDGNDPETKSWYDALGRRVQKEQIAEGDNWVKRYYFAGWQALHEVDWASSTETITHRWVYGPWIDEPLEYADIAANPDKFFYYHDDRLGSLRAIADVQGVIKEAFRYSEWGETATYDGSFVPVSDPDMSPIGNRWAFTGRQLEEDIAEVGYFFRSRHCDQASGRFLQRDPASHDELGDSNSYAYVRNHPQSAVDPSGKTVIGGQTWTPCPDDCVVTQVTANTNDPGGCFICDCPGVDAGATDDWVCDPSCGCPYTLITCIPNLCDFYSNNGRDDLATICMAFGTGEFAACMRSCLIEYYAVHGVPPPAATQWGIPGGPIIDIFSAAMDDAHQECIDECVR
jgi:RHS repeat-associated protein